MNDWDSVTVTSGVLTPELLEAAVAKSLDSFGQAEIILVHPTALDDFIEYQELERKWSKYPPYIRKQLQLKHKLQAKWSNKPQLEILPLPL